MEGSAPHDVDAELSDGPCPGCGAEDGSEVARVPSFLPPADGRRYRYVRCEGCALVHLAPPLSEEELEPFYGPGYLPFRGPSAWGRWAHWVRRGLEAMARRRAAVTLRATGLRDGASVLDIGSGRPLFLKELTERLAVRAVAWDRTDAAWRDDPGAWRPVELRAGPLESTLETGPFHAVTLWHVLEHVARPVDFLRTLRLASGPETTLVAEVPDHSAWTRRFQGAFWAGYDAPRHLVAFEPESLRHVVEEAGWEVVRIDRAGTLDPWLLWWLGRQGARGRGLEGSLAPDFPGFVAGKVLTWPLVAARRGRGLGLQTVVARAS
jgi:hypothetical protein